MGLCCSSCIHVEAVETPLPKLLAPKLEAQDWFACLSAPGWYCLRRYDSAQASGNPGNPFPPTVLFSQPDSLPRVTPSEAWRRRIRRRPPSGAGRKSRRVRSWCAACNTLRHICKDS